MNTKSALEKLTDWQRKTLETNKTHLTAFQPISHFEIMDAINGKAN